jgi:hypothetical protein
LIQSGFAYCQNNLANAKFEDAQEAYAVHDYKLVLSKLKEAKTILKTSSEKIMHLQVMAQTQMVKMDPGSNFELIQATKNLAGKYLKDYEKTASALNFREVYKAESYLSDFAVSKEEFQKQFQVLEAKKQEQAEKLKENENVFMDYNYFPEYTLGLTVEEMLKKHKNLKKYKEVLMQRKFSYYTPTFTFKNNKVDGYSAFLDNTNGVYGGSVERTDAECEKYLKYFTKKFMFAPEEKTEYIKEYSLASTTYIWKKNNKTFMLNKTHSVMDRDVYMGHITIGSTDENLSK